MQQVIDSNITTTTASVASNFDSSCPLALMKRLGKFLIRGTA